MVFTDIRRIIITLQPKINSSANHKNDKDKIHIGLYSYGVFRTYIFKTY